MTRSEQFRSLAVRAARMERRSYLPTFRAAWGQLADTYSLMAANHEFDALPQIAADARLSRGARIQTRALSTITLNCGAAADLMCGESRGGNQRLQDTMLIQMPRMPSHASVVSMTRSSGQLAETSSSDVPNEAAWPQSLLLVEDDAFIREVLLDALMARDYDVVAAATCEDAVRMMAGGLRPPVVVTDINLGPGCSGLDLADKVRERDSELPIVFITGRMDMLRDRGVRNREFILPKPFALAVFLELIGRLAVAAS